MRAVLLAVNLAMYANPVGLIVAGVAALIAVIGLAVYYFDDLRDMLKGTAWGEPILFAVDSIAELLKMLGRVAVAVFSGFISIVQTVWQALQPVASFLLDVVVFALKLVGAIAGVVFGVMAYAIGSVANLITWLAGVIYNGFSAAFNFVISSWQSVVAALSNFEWFNNLLAAASGVGEFMGQLWDGIKTQFAQTWGWIVEKLNSLPGINIAVDPVMSATKLTANLPNQQTMPDWMQRQAANDAASFGPAMAKLPIDVQPVANSTLASTITPKYNQQAAASAQANRKATQSVNTGKTLSFGDVIVQNPPKNWSLSELADQQELRTA